MTIQSHAIVTNTTNQNVLACNSSLTTFQYTFPIIDTANATDLYVYQNDNLGNQTAITTNYSVNTTTGTVTYPVTGTACPTGYQIVLLRKEPFTQGVAASYQGPGPTPPVMNMADKLTMITQQLNNSSVQSAPGTSGTLMLPPYVAGDLIGWGGSLGLVNIANPSAVAQWSLNGANISYNTGNVSTSNNLSSATLNTTGNVGIGSATPGSILDVFGTSRFLSGNVGVGSTVPGQLLDVKGTARVSNLLSTGNVGINSANPSQSLDVIGTARVTNLLSTGNVGINSASPGSLLDVQGNVRVLNGNIGIGMTPAKQIDVNGYIRANGGFIDTAVPTTGLSFNTNYGPAVIDGTIYAYATAAGGGGSNITCVTDSGTTPTTIISQMGGTTTSISCSATVYAGNYYRVNSTVSATAFGFYPK